jgi:hypothetical protein
MPGNGVGSSICDGASIPPIRSGTFQAARGIQNLLTIITLGDIQQLVDGLEPIIGIEGIH